MKRSLEDDAAGITKRSRSDASAMPSELFSPTSKRRVKGICLKGTDGTGFIEGKVFATWPPSNGNWEFVLTAEHGSQPHVVLTGRCAEYFDSIPLFVGAVVQIACRGLSLEPYDAATGLRLPKKFIWREGVALNVNNPKDGTETFVDTWDGQDVLPITPIEPDPPSPRTFTKRKRSSADPHPPSPHRDDAAPRRVSLDTTPAGLRPRSSTPLQNPQSLPSPPPDGRVPDPIEDQPPDPTSAPPSAPAGPSRGHETPVGGQPRSPPPFAISPQGPIVGTALPALPLSACPPPAGKPLTEDQKRKKAQKREARKLKQRALVAKRAVQPPADPVAGPSVVSDVHSSQPPANNDSEQYWDAVDDISPDDLTEHTPELGSNRTNAPPAQQREPEEPPQNPGAAPTSASQELMVPCSVENLGITYTLLANVQPQGIDSIMGVVRVVNPVRSTKQGECQLTTSLHDPSNFAMSPFRVTLFAKHEDHLPRLEDGDVLCLRTILSNNFNNSVIKVGASFKAWQFAVYHSKSGTPVDLSQVAPRHFALEGAELRCAMRLSDWWREQSEQMTFIEDVAPAPSAARGWRRKHQLISEVKPDQYFDCTVEVLHGYRHNTLGVFTLYVTDYTKNNLTTRVERSWCAPKLAELVLQIELWDSAALVGPTMQSGEYWSLKNVRMRISMGGYLEGKIQEGNKLTKLNEDQLEGQPNLLALLTRRRAWDARMQAGGDMPPEFPHKLFSEAEPDRHFLCTVEVVRMSGKNDHAYMYVTDYTAREDLVPISPTIAVGDMATRVVRIALSDAQVEPARALAPGDFVAIRNLRLRPSGAEGKLSGKLGGDQRLITKLNPKSSGNQELDALLRRKEEWKTEQSRPKRNRKAKVTTEPRRSSQDPIAGPSQPAPSLHPSPSQKQPPPLQTDPRGRTTLAKVKASEECPSVFLVRARVVDFYPENIADCVLLHCTHCGEALKRIQRLCTKCDEAMDDSTSAEATFQLFFRIQDEEGTTMEVVAAHDQLSIAQGLQPEDILNSDTSALVERLQPLLGDLLEVQDGIARLRMPQDDAPAPETPLLDLAIGHWIPEDEPESPSERLYIIMRHSLIEDDG